ncbi:D-alanyl-D-alanine carboxypeptidase/D-alanyl-D-alanine endopeptidase [Sagittula stellata]|uniref:D-alanyl-D-alanine carboxypeptidase/D-alanyl-D-alanine-endopeptidase n=1 Tax=Sagittula stellata (strain ATCC 700073 / DSM 11524 / E-37) TaxID=388399 RepID=A3K612_SAGS3|nr:D-alanyl-D-alanine carboxypeptidase/D-alanyl-D-alanine-endopeptidase [Sagittula stellata]EBA07551.1 D-alanyl-D-alanine carboxypeptidase/D-alanyl-D-alanine-endopeptidase [Sagittula stellata E-37]
MTTGVSRRSFLFGAGALALSAGGALAGPPEVSLRPVARGEDLRLRNLPSIDELIARARLDGTVGFCVSDAATGEVLESHDPDQGLPPASVAKALTSGYALAQLGPDHRFETRVMVTGAVRDGVVQGDVILAGGGDPSLETDDLATLAQRLKASGVTGATGGFRVWGGALPYQHDIDTAQPDHVGYNPSVSGLCLNFNRVHFEWRRAGGDYEVTMDARSGAHRPEVRMARMAVEARSVPVYTYSDANGQDAWTVAKGALGSGGARWLPVRKPELYAGEVFQSFARAQGIKLGAPQVIETLPEGAEPVARIESGLLTDILHDMMKYSTNLTAEVVGLSASRVRLGRMPRDLRESAGALNDWAEESLGVPGIGLVDHSGLGDLSRVPAARMMEALVALHREKQLKPLMKPFLMRDAQRRVMDNHPISVHAKTGTLNFVSGLAGFADLPKGRELAFAIFTADLDRRAALTVEERERPEGASSWNVRAKMLQQALIERWGVLYEA